MVILLSNTSHAIEPLNMVSLKLFNILFKSDQDGVMVKSNYNKLNKIIFTRWVDKTLNQTYIYIYIILRFKVTRIWLFNPKHHNEKINPNNLYTLVNAKKAKMDDYLSTTRKVTRSKEEHSLLQQS